MKPASLFLLSILIFLFTTPALSTPILATNDDFVLDVQGNPLEKDVGYFLSLPGRGAASGRVSLTSPLQNNETCEAEVVLVRPALLPNSGTPFTFTPVTGSEDVIRLLSPLAIQSPTQNPCGDSTIWQISYREELSTTVITTGGIINTMGSCFRVVQTQTQLSSTLYSFEHCRGTCGPTREATSCSPVGTTQSESGEYLSVGGSLLSFQFIKNSESAANQDVM